MNATERRLADRLKTMGVGQLDMASVLFTFRHAGEAEALKQAEQLLERRRANLEKARLIARRILKMQGGASGSPYGHCH